MIRIVEAVDDDRAFLFEMFLTAAFWSGPAPEPTCADVVQDPALGQYVRGWGRPADAALIARVTVPVGAAWYRLFTPDDPGYGFVDDATPELGVAVTQAHRGQGVGAALLRALTDHAGRAGFRALSLSVSTDNPARRLYEALGFERLHDVGRSTTMRLALR